MVVAAYGFRINNVTHFDIGATILEFHVNQLTEESGEINLIHEPLFDV